MKTYKISEVAKKFDITRTALIHYDKWKILSPSIRNEKNYRYYTTEDIKKLELILALKESGLSLNEIKSYLHEKISKTSIELLIQQKKEIDMKIETLQEQSIIIEKRIEHLSKFDKIDVYEGIKVTEYPEMSITVETIGFGPLMNYSAAVNKLKNKLNKDGQLTSKYGICYDLNHKDNIGKYVKKYLFDYLSESNDPTHTTKLPKRLYLRSIHIGQQYTIEESIENLLNYARNNNYDVSIEAYYIPLFDYWESMSDVFVGEILIPLQ